MLTVDNLPAVVKFNYAVHHSGLDSWDRIAIRNRGSTKTEPALLEVSWSAFARPHVLPVPALQPGETYPSGRRTVPLLDVIALGTLIERQKLTWDVRSGEMPIHRSDVLALAAREWTWAPGVEAALAAFVQPNCIAARDVLGAASSGLDTGYQNALEEGHEELLRGGPAAAWTRAARQIYECIRHRFHWRYEYEPPSFEADSQKVRDPDTVWKDLEGTCLDLAVAFASCLERAHLQPLIIVLRRGGAQHALAGWWVRPRANAPPVLRSKADLCSLVTDALEVVECTGFADGKDGGKPIEKTGFEGAVAAARRAIREFDLWCVVDVRGAREQLDITPLAALCGTGDPWNAGLHSYFQMNALPIGSWTDRSGWFTERAAWILYRAIREASVGATGTLRLQHIFLALLGQSGPAESALELLEHDPARIRGRLIHALRRSSSERPRAVQPTQAVRSMIEDLWSGAKSSGVLVTEEALLSAAVRRPDNETVRRLIRDLGTTHATLVDAVNEVTSHALLQTPENTDTFPEAR